MPICLGDFKSYKFINTTTDVLEDIMSYFEWVISTSYKRDKIDYFASHDGHSMIRNIINQEDNLGTNYVIVSLFVDYWWTN